MKKNQEYYKKSLGNLRPAEKTQPRSPDAIGKITIQRELMQQLCEQLNDGGGVEVTAKLAAWRNNKGNGEFLTIEIQSQRCKRLPTPQKIQTTNRSLFSMFDDEQDYDEQDKGQIN